MSQFKTSLRDYPQACFGDVGDVVNISKIIANYRFILRRYLCARLMILYLEGIQEGCNCNT